MTTYAYPAVTPTSTKIQYAANTETFVSPITGAIQTIDRGGERWIITLQYTNLKGDDVASITSFLAKLNGQQHRVTLPFFGVDNQGAFGGTPVVNGASQTGTTLDIRGGTDGVTGWIKAGDFFSFNSELKICTADANTSSASPGGGTATISFSPRIRTSPSDGDSILTTAPTGVFMLAGSTQSWNYRPGDFSDFTIQIIEDIAA